MDARLITLVVPVFNEQLSLEDLAREIREVAAGAGLRVQVVFVDDGSTDESWSVIRRLAEADPAVGGLRFRRNAGKAAAMMAGFAAGQGEIFVTLDADLQDPPAEIPRLIEALDAGSDLVSGWKQHRLDPWHKVYPSRVFNKLVSGLTGVRLHDHVCGLKACRSQVARSLRIHGELHRFLTVLAAARGYRVTEIPTRHRPRTTGVGKYGFSRFTKGFIDLFTVLVLTRYRWRPQHLIGGIGLWLFAAGVLMLPCPWLRRISAAVCVPLAGLLLMALGWLAAQASADRPLDDLYDVAERTGWCAQREASAPPG